ncbi:MAG TPA: phosphomannomutase [Sulfurovum sp.]|nr:phosphomannomutase [Sulfurovum sp.]
MMIKIDEEEFDPKEITQLYPAAVIKTGNGDETTQVSMQWVEKEGKDKVDLVGYGIFIHLGKDDVRTFMYDTRAEMDEVAASISEQIKQRRNGQ